MSDRIRAHLRSNVVGYIALFCFAMSGTASALDGINTVFSDDIVNGEVKAADIGTGELTSGDILNGTIDRQDLANGAVGGRTSSPARSARRRSKTTASPTSTSITRAASARRRSASSARPRSPTAP